MHEVRGADEMRRNRDTSGASRGIDVALSSVMRRVLFRIARVWLKVVLAFLLAIAITHLIAPDWVPRLLGRPQTPAEWRIPRADASPALASHAPGARADRIQHQDQSIG
jgi:hypothetical protein